MCLFGLIQRQPFTARCCATESYSKVRFFCFFFYFSWKCWKFSYEYTGNNIRTFYLVTFVSCTWCWCLVVVYVSVWYLFIMLESRLPDCSQAASTDERRYLYVFCVFFYPTFMIIFPFDKKKITYPTEPYFLVKENTPDSRTARPLMKYHLQHPDTWGRKCKLGHGWRFCRINYFMLNKYRELWGYLCEHGTF